MALLRSRVRHTVQAPVRPAAGPVGPRERGVGRRGAGHRHRRRHARARRRSQGGGRSRRRRDLRDPVGRLSRHRHPALPGRAERHHLTDDATRSRFDFNQSAKRTEPRAPGTGHPRFEPSTRHSLQRTMKILVVGGGVIGCATAYELAKAGCAVTLLERSTPGAEASGAAAGLLAPLGDSSAAFRDLAVASWRLYPGVARELRERTGIDVEHVTRGTIYPLYTADDVRQAEELARGARGLDLGVEAWARGAVHAHAPALSSQVGGAMFVRGDHEADNQRLVVAYAQAAVTAGVSLITGCGVSRVLVEDGRTSGVIAEGERHDADVVVLAAGAWTSALASSFGARLPVEPRRGQMLALTHVPPVITHAIHAEDVYLVPRPSGELLVGATV